MDTRTDHLDDLPIVVIGEICQKCGAKLDVERNTRPPGTPNPIGYYGSCSVDENWNVTSCDQCASRMN